MMCILKKEWYCISDHLRCNGCLRRIEEEEQMSIFYEIKEPGKILCEACTIEEYKHPISDRPIH